MYILTLFNFFFVSYLLNLLFTLALGRGSLSLVQKYLASFNLRSLFTWSHVLDRFMKEINKTMYEKNTAKSYMMRFYVRQRNTKISDRIKPCILWNCTFLYRFQKKNSHFNLLVLEASNLHSKPVIKDTSNTFTHNVLFEIFRFETHLLARARKDSREFTSDRSKGRGLR